MQETEVAGVAADAAPEAPVKEAPPDDGLPPVEPPSETAEAGAPAPGETPTEEPAEPVEPETWESYRERLPEATRAEYEEELEQIKRTAHKEGRSEAQTRYSKVWVEMRDAAQAAQNGANAVWRTLGEMSKKGSVDVQELSAVLEQNQPAFHALTGIQATLGQHTGLKNFVNFALGGEWTADANAPGGVRWTYPDENTKLASEFVNRFDEAFRDGYERPQDVVKDFVEEIEQRAEERGFQRGLKKGRSTTVESAKATERSGQAPTHAGGGAGSGEKKPWAELSAAQREEIKGQGDAAVDRYINQYG